ncbi:MAG: hypothetical protein US57_C0006G0008 [Candidatus Moranbacteria bacterium GW2011_GWC2_37_73]|nr:MAG: hypothetical protein UR95_C0007G0012 [Parcubacteria group bacterium GW2011_GWC1_36_108]KKQ00063.1 MAG: hypothetical protein US09_C0022G0009 [Candidatus Moranbacteria bacterium GW2011_GWD1_36_198]KKQ01155.1 MAG: hypothetical protein US10_C0021G0013 [Candidatus Moranbacteria bacterium GW2011_GWD2_36_198]KKQ39936.1 MAG: hypothetical protein US57_C0006G0008 [Candidatus Moranbacteria bacterium GW2011_GWC2_37_73]HAR99685.1 hypothetical protein [Candidatus Moranbacteria bacterium]
MQLDKLFSNFGLASSAAELVTLILVLLVLSTLFWLLVGRFRLHNFLINMYISLAILQVIPKDVMAFSKNSSILVFLISVVLLTLLNKYLFDIHQSGSGLALWQVFVMSFFEVVLLLSIVISFLPAKEVTLYISKNSLSYFIDPLWRLVWMIAPLAFLVFVRKREK